jgi:hypothetical protein
VLSVVGPLRAKDGNLVADNGIICNILNDFFASVFTDEVDLKELLEVKKRLMEESYMPDDLKSDAPGVVQKFLLADKTASV